MHNKKMLCACLCLLTTLWSIAQEERRMNVEELFTLIENANHTLNAKLTSVSVAQQGIEEAKTKRLPDIDASLSVSYNGNVLITDRDFTNARGASQPHFGNAFSVEARQVVYAGGAITTGIRLAELQKQMAENEVVLTRNQLRFIAIGQLLDIAKLDNGIRVYESNIALTERLIADIKAKQAQGMALKNDVTRYELQLESLTLGKRQLEDQKRILSHQLCNATGIAESTIVADIDLNTATYALLSEADLQADAEANAPEMRKAALQTGIAEQQLRLAKSELLPKVAVVAADNFAGPFSYDIPPINKNFNVWYVGVGLKYALSSLYKSKKSIAKAEAQVRLSHDAHQVASEHLNNGVHQAFTLHQQAFAELRTRQKSVELARQNFSVVQNRYTNQLALITDMIDASNIKLDSELQAVNAQINIAYTFYQLKYLTGKI
ncbi:MAG: TolC family protein [Sodaliphilus sp.]